MIACKKGCILLLFPSLELTRGFFYSSTEATILPARQGLRSVDDFKITVFSTLEIA